MHRRTERVGKVEATARGLDVDRVIIMFDDGNLEGSIPATECTLLLKWAIHVNSGGATFVKAYDFFVQQGGTTDDWGKHWKIVHAKDIHEARTLAIKLPGAKTGLYCAVCGREDIQCICVK